MNTVVNANNTEFGYSLIATIPYAYALHLNGELGGTVDAPGSEPYYYFSKNHIIDPKPRDFANTAEAAKSIPNMWIHKPVLDKSNWVPPPYRDIYQDRAIKFSKPTVVIYNRYNQEWGKPPINFFDLNILRTLISMLSDQYQVVYFNVRGEEVLEDNAHSMELGDYDMIRREFPSVRIIHDLVREHDSTYNDVQLRVFAGCSRFITMNGAPSILASYFGGENIIYTKQCRELAPNVNSFYNWYPDFGGSNIKVVGSYNELATLVRSKWINRDPLINILVRCRLREQGLARLFDSILKQDYHNWRVICSYEDERTWRYLCKYPCQKLRVTHSTEQPEKPEGDDYRQFLHANTYLNQMGDLVDDGYITYMDDDDYYEGRDALQKIAKKLDRYKLLVWRAKTESGKKIPSDGNWKTVTAGDISGIAFAFHSSQKRLAQWEPWRRGDYRVIKSLSGSLKTIWIDEAVSVIGKQPPERGTKEYIAKKMVQHSKKLDAIREKVAERMAITVQDAAGGTYEVQTLPPPPPPPSVTPDMRCPHCGYMIG